MKLDSDRVFCRGPVNHVSDTNPIPYSDNSSDSVVLKSGKKSETEYEKEVSVGMKCRDGDADGLPYVGNENSWTTAKLDCSMSAEDFTPDDEKKVRDFVHVPPKVELYEKGSVFYMDKSVMEQELPELIVCYKEPTYHVVKDICVDEGLPSQDKFLFDTDLDEKSVHKYLPAEQDLKGDTVKEKFDLDMPISDFSEKENVNLDLPIADLLKNSAEEKGSECDYPLEFDSKDSMLTMEVREHETEKMEKDRPKEIFSLGDLLSMPVLGEKHSHFKSCNSSLDKVEQQSLQRPSENPVSLAGSSCEPSGNGNGEADHGQEEAILATLVQNSTAGASHKSHSGDGVSEESAGRNMDEFSCNTNSETRSLTCNFDTSAPTASGREECCQKDDSDYSYRREDPNCHPSLTQLQYIPGESSFSASGQSQLQYTAGESSFSAAGPLSGLITYSGPIAYSGSLSVRSDSSTTSARSFAFPVLQNEWNSSPVRMAKADRRHFRKHRGWRQGLLCCRF